MGTRWFSRRALTLHATVIIVIPVFLALCDWQVHRALSGNELSWAYVFEWPFFAAYAVFMWWRLVHDQDLPIHLGPKGTARDQPPGGGKAGTQARAIAGGDPGEPSNLRPVAAGERDPDPVDEELVAYNRYLAALNESGRHKRW